MTACFLCPLATEGSADADDGGDDHADADAADDGDDDAEWADAADDGCEGYMGNGIAIDERCID